MTIQEQIENIEKTLAELKSQLEKESKEENKRWRGDKDEIYYYESDLGMILNTIDTNNKSDDFRYKTRNYFKTMEETEKHLEKINTYYELMDLAEKLNGDKEIDWKNKDQCKIKISYSNKNGMQQVYTYVYKNMGEIYCLDSNFLDIAKERIGEDRLIKLFK